jgi:hypothetical protein
MRKRKNRVGKSKGSRRKTATRGTRQKDQILRRITERYLTSGDFNGLPIDNLGRDIGEVRRLVRILVIEDKVVLNFGDRHPNPHILAFESEPQSKQIEKLDRLVFEPPAYEEWGPIKIRTNSTNCCAYPSKTHLRTVVDVSKYQLQPYTLLLALGEPQLAYRAFNLRVLEFYRNDPRYSYDTDDIHGHISVRSGKVTDPADDTFLETFGFAFNKDLSVRYVAVFLRYLSQLTPEHQQRWRLDQVDGGMFLHPDYAKSSVGDWSAQESVFNAFCEEMGIINEMAIKIRGVRLFRETYSKQTKPVGFGFLIKPTKKEYETFVHLLDKMLSDNLNKKFFEGQIDLTLREEKDGLVIEKQKGTITLLSDWLAKRVKLSEPSPKDKMIETFKNVRKERGPLAHEVQVDEWNDQYFAKQRELMIEAYGAIRTLRLILAIHPSSISVEVPDWLYRAEIRPY